MEEKKKIAQSKDHGATESAKVSLKVCGMKYRENIVEVANLLPDYLGFIFFKNSPRNFSGTIPEIDSSIQKVGVFVDASLDFILEKIQRYGFKAVQLHGSESPQFCAELKDRNNQIDIIKVFSIKDDFNFDAIAPYEKCCDYYLFDTKGKLPGGNGFTFDWKVLENYPSSKPYFLSGGIGLESVAGLKEFFKTEAAKYCKVIDVNSRFEIKPAFKDHELLQRFAHSIE